MSRLLIIFWWSLLLASGGIAFLRFLHPATFSRAVFTGMLCAAFISLVFALNKKRYE